MNGVLKLSVKVLKKEIDYEAYASKTTQHTEERCI